MMQRKGVFHKQNIEKIKNNMDYFIVFVSILKKIIIFDSKLDFQHHDKNKKWFFRRTSCHTSRAVN
jgi:hypothetical protein